MATSKQLEEIAYHEAAHAVFFFKFGLRHGLATIKPDRATQTLGHVKIRRPKWMGIQPGTPLEEMRQRLRAEREILSLFAGRIAEARYAKRRINWGHEGDYHTIADFALSFISYDTDIHHAFLVYCEKVATAYVDAWWVYIQAVAEALVERRTLTNREFRKVIAAIPLEAFEQHRKQQKKATRRS
jgi:hypothetical protein